MIAKVKIPKPSANIGEVAVTRWFKSENEAVAKGEPLAELTTDKAVFEMDAPVAGVVRKILAREKSVLPVGYVIALVGPPDEPLPDVATWNRNKIDALRGDRPAAALTKRSPEPERATAGGTVRATPAARRLAREKGIDLKAVARELAAERIDEKTLANWLTAQGEQGEVER